MNNLNRLNNFIINASLLIVNAAHLMCVLKTSVVFLNVSRTAFEFYTAFKLVYILARSFVSMLFSAIVPKFYSTRILLSSICT